MYFYKLNLHITTFTCILQGILTTGQLINYDGKTGKFQNTVEYTLKYLLF